MTPHEVLGVSPSASLAELKAARRHLLASLHPDRLTGEAEAGAFAVRAIEDAYRRASAGAADHEPAAATPGLLERVAVAVVSAAGDEVERRLEEPLAQVMEVQPLIIQVGQLLRHLFK